VARKEAAEVSSRVEQAEAERERMAELVVANNASVQQLRNELESLQSQLSQQGSATSVAMKGDTSAEMRRLQARIDAQAENRQRYAQEMRATRAQVAELEARCRKLQSQIDASVS
jgi:chromosome segregation ATPase